MLINCLAVGTGGALGAAARYIVGLIPVKETTLFPVKTFWINIIGCIVIALIVSMIMRGAHIGERTELFLKTGICGGFTTFSTFALETAELMRAGHMFTAFSYVVLSVIAGVGIVMFVITR